MTDFGRCPDYFGDKKVCTSCSINVTLLFKKSCYCSKCAQSECVHTPQSVPLVHDVACRATAVLKYPSLPEVPDSPGPVDPSHTLFVLIKIKLCLGLARPTVDDFLLFLSGNLLSKCQAKPFSSLLSNLARLCFHVPMLFLWGYDKAEQWCVSSVVECGAEWACVAKRDEKV